MGMYRHKMPDRELSEEMTKADYWEVQADMWHQNYKEAADEIERLREILKMWAKFWEADNDDNELEPLLAEEAMEATREALGIE